VFSRAVQKILGGQLLTDLSGFVAALDSTFGGFRERAERTYRVLQARETAFLVVAAPEPDAVREARFFADRLERDRMPLAGMVLNRTHHVLAAGVDPEAAASAADELAAAGDQRAADVLRIHVGLAAQVRREMRVASTFVAAYPRTPIVAVAAQPADVHNIDGLREIGAALAANSD
jgi:anion-transporting  ArsA/GET3 family ATPase